VWSWGALARPTLPDSSYGVQRGMRILVTGSAGHLGEALMRTLACSEHEAVGLDIKGSPFTHRVGSIVDRGFVEECMRGIEVVLHTATLHKPHIETHSRTDFIDTNITGALNLLELAVAAGVTAFIFTSTTSTFGRALAPREGGAAAWITEDVVPIPKNIYGLTKLAAENLCELIHRKSGLPCIVLRTARFFPDPDDDRVTRDLYSDENLKINDFLYRRADIEDVVTAHMLAVSSAPTLGFDRLIISATTPFTREDMAQLGVDAAEVVRRRCPDYQAEYRRRGWSFPRTIDRVYVNERARERLGWQPKYDFDYLIGRLRANEDFRSPLAGSVGSKLYHAEKFSDGPYPVS
jgi:nucleoside-diphosphate-sugar epimerase